MIRIPFTVSHPDLTPTQAHPGDSGMDLRAARAGSLMPGVRCLVPTGLRVAIPEGYEGQVSYVTGDPKQPQVADYMNRAGLNVIDIDKKAQADRAVGHRRLVDLMSVDPNLNHPMLFVAEDRCPKTTVEWKHLRYREKMTNEYGPSAFESKCDDHAYDAARYFVMTRPAPAKERPERDWMREAQRARRSNLTYNATRGMGRWGRTGISPYSRAM